MRRRSSPASIVHRILVAALAWAVVVVMSSTTSTGGRFGVASAAMTDPATGIAFAPKVGGLEVFGVGVRRKGPIKVYSVAMYGVTALKDKLASFSKSDPQAVQTLRSDVVSSGEAADSDAGAAVFDLHMSFKVSGDKMASAIAESVLPRFAGPKDEIDQLKTMISSGVGQDGATKGTQFRFECGPNGIAVSVNGQSTGSIASKPLAQAFCDVYLDDKCVSPALRTSILENCCAP